jgi:hypothetical protein
MPNITLTKTETSLLTDAAGREHGLVVLPRTMKAATAQRLLGKLMENGAVTAREHDGSTDHHLTPAGYRAVGLKAPRRARATASASEPAGYRAVGLKAPRRARATASASEPTLASQPGTKQAADPRPAVARGGGEPRRADRRHRMASAYDPGGSLPYSLRWAGADKERARGWPDRLPHRAG